MHHLLMKVTALVAVSGAPKVGRLLCAMALLPVDTRHLFPDLRAGLTDLLRGLRADEWEFPTACEGWAVRDVVGHLVGVDLGNVARRRDQHRPPWPPGWDLARFNDQWVWAARRLSTWELIDLADIAGRWFEEYLNTLDLDSPWKAPSWAGDGPAPYWLDMAREYTERWVHQQQIRTAVGVPGLHDDTHTGPVIATFVHALPVALRQACAPVGAVVVFRVTGTGGGVWHLVRDHDGWDLRPGDAPSPVAVLTTDVHTAWRRMTNDTTVPAPAVEGDAALGDAMAKALAIEV